MEIFIYGEIDNSAKKGAVGDVDIKNQLDKLQPNEPLEVHINSIGGVVSVGISIYNLLKKWEGKKTVIIDGWACSIASVVAMAGDEIIIADNGLMMIHKPLLGLQGNASAMRKAAQTLDTVEATFINAYTQKTGQPVEKIAAWLESETWFTATECVNLGFADRIERNHLRAVARLSDELIAKLNVPENLLEITREKEPTAMNTRDLQQAIAEVRSQYEGMNDVEIMKNHAGFDLLLNKLHEQETKETQIKNEAQTQKREEAKNFMENEKMNDTIRILAKTERFEALHASENEPVLSLGKIVKGAILGDWTNAADEQKIYAANTTTAGILVPESLSAQVIEAARNESALSKAGVLTVSCRPLP